MAWLSLPVAEGDATPPWQRAMAQRQSILGIALSVQALDGPRETGDELRAHHGWPPLCAAASRPSPT